MTTSSPAAIAGARIGSIDATIASLERLGTVLLGLIVVAGVARTFYGRGYQDGFRVADQVIADRPPQAVPA